MKLILTSLLQFVWGYFWSVWLAESLLSVINITAKLSHFFQKCNRNSGHTVWWFAWSFGYVVIELCTPTVRSWWSHWVVMALSLLFMMKVMVWHFMSNSHKVMTALIVMLPSIFCCGDFSVILYIYTCLHNIWLCLLINTHCWKEMKSQCKVTAASHCF